jgi:hypothetical protein
MVVFWQLMGLLFLLVSLMTMKFVTRRITDTGREDLELLYLQDVMLSAGSLLLAVTTVAALMI